MAGRTKKNLAKNAGSAEETCSKSKPFRGIKAHVTGQQEREEIAEVTDDAVICVVGIQDLQKMMKDNPKFNTEILKFIGFRLKRVQSRLESLIFKNAEQRIRSLIKELGEDHGRTIAGDENQREVKLGLTHEDIAKLTATSRQTVTTQLNELEKSGLIKYDRKRYISGICTAFKLIACLLPYSLKNGTKHRSLLLLFFHKAGKRYGREISRGKDQGLR